MNSQKTCLGVTLIELQIVIAIIAITGAIVLSIGNIVDKFQVDAVGNQVYAHFALARNESFKRGENISICASTNGTTCNTDAWRNGWIVYTNSNNNSIIESNEIIIALKQQINTELTIISDNNNRIDFQANGAVLAPRNIRVCRQGAMGTWRNIINIDQTGRITKTTDFGDCL